MFDAIAAVSSRWNVLTHPFYVRWERGELTRADLALYAAEYRHAVVALAEASEIAGEGPHAEEERGHVALWDAFAGALGAPSRAPSAETAACAASWTPADALEATAVLYAVEGAQPAIAATKLRGLVEHYGFAADSPALEYFRVHAERDHAHAREAAEILSRDAGPAAHERLVSAAEAALRGNWQLLDGVERALAA